MHSVAAVGDGVDAEGVYMPYTYVYIYMPGDGVDAEGSGLVQNEAR